MFFDYSSGRSITATFLTSFPASVGNILNSKKGLFILKKILSLILSLSMIGASAVSVSAVETTADKEARFEYSIKKAIECGESSVPMILDDREKMGNIYLDVINSNPRLYNVSSSYSFGEEFSFARLMDKKEYQNSVDTFVTETNKLLGDIYTTDSDYEKTLAIYNKLISHCETPKVGSMSNTSHNTAYSAIVNRTANSRGLALAYKYLLGAVGINSEVSHEGKYYWNVVTIDGQKYNSDVYRAVKHSPDAGHTTYARFLFSDLSDAEKTTISNSQYATNYEDDIPCTSKKYNDVRYKYTSSLVIRKDKATYYELNGVIHAVSDNGAYSILEKEHTWSIGKSYCRIANCGNYILFTRPTSVISYNIASSAFETIFELPKTEKGEIYGLAIDGDKLYLNIATGPASESASTNIISVDLSNIEFNFTTTNWLTAVVGDTNGDGRVSIVDATNVQRYLCQVASKDQYNLYGCDINNDGKINILDVILIQRKLASRL